MKSIKQEFKFLQKEDFKRRKKEKLISMRIIFILIFVSIAINEMFFVYLFIFLFLIALFKYLTLGE